MLLLTIETLHKINVIKRLRQLTGWGLYEAKEGVEQGLIFDDAAQMCAFMQRILLEVDGRAVFEVKPYRKGGPQDATSVRF